MYVCMYVCIYVCIQSYIGLRVLSIMMLNWVTSLTSYICIDQRLNNQAHSFSAMKRVVGQ